MTSEPEMLWEAYTDLPSDMQLLWRKTLQFTVPVTEF
jgi:hypothetical protein